MTEYWKSVGNYYCDYCKIFVRNDSFNRRQHEASPRHEGALKRQVRDIHRNSEKEARNLLAANRELARIGGKTNLEKKPEPSLPKKINIGNRPKKVEKIDTLDDSAVYKAALAAQAMPGQWSTVEVPESRVTISEASEIKQTEDELKVKAEEREYTEEDPQPTESTLLEHNYKHKRRRDGADEDLITFRVQTKVDKAIDEDALDGADVPVVTFKKKKSKPNANVVPKIEPS